MVEPRAPRPPRPGRAARLAREDAARHPFLTPTRELPPVTRPLPDCGHGDRCGRVECFRALIDALSCPCGGGVSHWYGDCPRQGPAADYPVRGGTP